jgi:site-specific DNA-methyltransferase (adenine-specific)
MVEPYFQNDWATLYLGDAEEIIPTIPTDSVHLLLADPPYGQEFKSNRGSHIKIHGDDSTEYVRVLMGMACKPLRRGRHAYVFGPAEVIPEQLTATADLIWDKEIVGMGDLSQPWGLSHENITFAVYEPSKANRVKGYGNLSARMRQGSVIRAQRTNGAATLRHPTEKPVKLLRQLIESSSVMDEVVFDPFAGVGSTLVAAVLEGRRGIGVEIHEPYAEIAAKRLEKLRFQEE